MNSLKWRLSDDYSPKQVALFKSVVSILEEGVPSSSMKVSEIAARAGIGKGTTYEYFKSKEELIAEAILYDVKIRITELAERVEKVDGFKNMFEIILDWLEENFQAKHVLNKVLGIDGTGLQLSGEICSMVKSHTETAKQLNTGLVDLMNVAEAEGLICEQTPQSLRNISFINQMFSYVAYLKMESSITDVSKQEIKEFLYNAMIRALQA